MPSEILVINSVNYVGQIAYITFTSCTDNSVVVIGNQTLPYSYVSGSYYGIYELYYTSNENPTPRKFIGTGNQLASIKEFKFVNYENCEKMCENIKTSQTPKID